jgi:hypothetical protein
MRARMIVATAAMATAFASLTSPVAAVPTTASGDLGTRVVTASHVVGRIAFVSRANRVEVVRVRANGTTGRPRRIGPVTSVAKGAKLEIESLVASRDGHWLAWTELDEKPQQDIVQSTLVLRHMTSGRDYEVRSPQMPLGFAGDKLVTSEYEQDAAHFVTGSRPRLKKIKLPRCVLEVLASSKHGVVAMCEPRSVSDTTVQRLLDVSFSGRARTIHSYAPISANDPSLIEDGWSSSDGKRLIVEHGDHTDFGGVGPTSTADELNPNTRSTPDHLGGPSGSKVWRMEQTTFAGAHDEPYAVWMTESAGSPEPTVFRCSGGAWHRVAGHSPVVAGSPNGAVVVQRGSYVQDAGVDFPAYHVAARGKATLINAGRRHQMSISGLAFAWL